MIDADQTARQVVEPGTECLREIVEVFGPDVLQPDGSLHRRKLGQIVFSDPVALQKLNAITHPRITAYMQAEAKAAQQAGSPAAVIDAAALFESGFDRCCTTIVAVLAPAEIRITRIMERDGLTEKEAEQRIRSQLPESVYRDRAQHILYNNGNRTELETQTQKLLRILFPTRSGL